MYVAHITHNGISRRYALVSFELEDAREEARLLGQSLFGGRFFYSVRAEQ